jgi:hypothetical protein
LRDKTLSCGSSIGFSSSLWSSEPCGLITILQAQTLQLLPLLLPPLLLG